MAERCPIIRAAYATDETVVIARAEKDHPPARCEYVKQAVAAEMEKQESEKARAA